MIRKLQQKYLRDWRTQKYVFSRRKRQTADAKSEKWHGYFDSTVRFFLTGDATSLY